MYEGSSTDFLSEAPHYSLWNFPESFRRRTEHATHSSAADRAETAVVPELKGLTKQLMALGDHHRPVRQKAIVQHAESRWKLTSVRGRRSPEGRRATSLTGNCHSFRSVVTVTYPEGVGVAHRQQRLQATGLGNENSERRIARCSSIPTNTDRRGF
jgi:hypothetical protein